MRMERVEGGVIFTVSYVNRGTTRQIPSRIERRIVFHLPSKVPLTRAREVPPLC